MSIWFTSLSINTWNFQNDHILIMLTEMYKNIYILHDLSSILSVKSYNNIILYTALLFHYSKWLYLMNFLFFLSNTSISVHKIIPNLFQIYNLYSNSRTIIMMITLVYSAFYKQVIDKISTHMLNITSENVYKIYALYIYIYINISLLFNVMSMKIWHAKIK